MHIQRRATRRVSVTLAALGLVVCLALATAKDARATHGYFTGNITSLQVCDIAWRVCGGYNTGWWSTETYKGTGAERLGFENSTTAKYIQDAGTYMYTDKNQLGIGGYIRPFVRNVSGAAIYNDVAVCVC